MFDKPKGGTELMYDQLMNRLPENYKEGFSIFNYLVNADFSKKTIYWNQLSYDQEAVKPLQETELVNKIDHFVFVSHWQAEIFRKAFNIPGYKTSVIKNAHPGIGTRQAGTRKKVRLCYTSTPWRGLDVLIRAWEILQPEDCELHIFSSTKIYGNDFAATAENTYMDLYQKCQDTKGVVYRGSIPNNELTALLPQFDILAYPCTFEETSCIAVIEALSAGLRVVTSNIGALPETTEGWARMYTYRLDRETHAQHFSDILNKEILLIREGRLNEHLQQQSLAYSRSWSWEERINQWIGLLDELQ